MPRNRNRDATTGQFVKATTPTATPTATQKEGASPSTPPVINQPVTGRSKLARLVGLQFAGQRDIDEALGYNTAPTLEDYLLMYARRGLAATIIDAPAKTTWRRPPEIESPYPEFNRQWTKLATRLKAFCFLERADRLAGIGRYSVLLIGVKGVQLSRPLVKVSSPQDIIYLSAFGEGDVEVHKYVESTNNARFGLPESYKIDLGPGRARVEVHWSHILHVAENLLWDEVYGEPRLQKVFNRLQDLDKIVGSSAEGYWQAASRGFAISPKAGFELSDASLADAREAWEDFVHGLHRVVATEGLDHKELSGTIVDPGPAFEVVISLISGKTGIPKRILLGSERGDLASSQDEANWLGKIAERQQHFAEPLLLRPLVDRFISVGALPNGHPYEVRWPSLFELNKVDKARVHSLTALAAKNLSGLIPEDLFSREELRNLVGLT